jgi:hypothetical protein
MEDAEIITEFVIGSSEDLERPDREMVDPQSRPRDPPARSAQEICPRDLPE